MKEWSQFYEENQRRTGAPLRGVALSFPPDGSGSMTNGMPSNSCAGIEQIPVTKVYGLGGLLWHREDYGIGEDARRRVGAALGL